jgi:hypothetical protein
VTPDQGTSADGQLDQYMALSKKDLRIHITLNELYNTHALLVQHRDALVSCSTRRG